MTPIPIEEFVARLRSDERHYRRTGRYNAAVTVQRQADIIEATGEYPLSYQYQERGQSEPFTCFLVDDSTLVIPSTNGAAALALSKDRVLGLVTQLLVFSGLSPVAVDTLAESYRTFKEEEA